MTWALRINGQEASSLGFHLRAKPGFDGRGGTPVQTTDLPDYDGTLLLQRRYGGRRVRYQGLLLTPANTAAARLAAQGVLRALWSVGLLRLESDNGLTEPLIAEGVMVQEDVNPIGGPEHAISAEMEYQVECIAGSFRVRERELVALGAQPALLPQGDAPSSWEALIHGPGTAISLRFRNGSGLITTDIPLGDLGSDEALRVRSGPQTIDEFAAGVASNGLARNPDALFPPYGLAPADGAEQTAEVTGGASGTLTWWRRFR